MTQFVIWIGNVLQGNFGESFFFKKTVAELIVERIEPTLSLAICTIVFAVCVAVPLGVLAAYRHGSLDRPGRDGLFGARLLGARSSSSATA